MFELTELSRVLCAHQWQHADEWAQALSRLADLDDGAIAELSQLNHDAAADSDC